VVDALAGGFSIFDYLFIPKQFLPKFSMGVKAFEI